MKSMCVFSSVNGIWVWVAWADDDREVRVSSMTAVGAIQPWSPVGLIVAEWSCHVSFDDTR